MPCASVPSSAFWRCGCRTRERSLFTARRGLSLSRVGQTTIPRRMVQAHARTRWYCVAARAQAPRPTGVAILVPERIDILQELGLTPVWRLRARYRGDATPIAPHAVNESALAAAPQADVENRVTRIAMLDWSHFAADVSACTACGLARTRKKAVPGVGDQHAEWLFVGEAPGAEEDAKGEPFVGQIGRASC